ncbi:AMP-binding protein [Caldimonas thermodepolymerans]|uniref:AMP-binding protein n=1 Tax=Caldimonas thermodepolymerans TaxID=215580 RepID=A0A2S5T4E2_9BURK|nr:AMP-binding protein [Caldimonas thermodepolymerans]PPE69768.1 AMP-binding protein [Caldimonas thermodepolymerans]QPC32603.1 AMP-binding protein [Caldimonas thermodepolymerans]RDI03350.1 acetyl-CoA synthetase [Caldimonas thermodepolymerans]TCP06791.1 acetyl-CoA synthetase [Caldimonas thermodepolymerans]UZG45406.1 AMP-binding protein [Caldimonas thermodepolymerans]
MTGDHRLYEALYKEFRWHVPAVFNIAEVCCGRWARQAPQRVAILYENEEGHRAQLRYGELQARANRLSHLLERLGVGPGDRVAIVMPQRFETAIAHMAVYQLGAVAMPLSMLFGPDALAYRLQDSEAKVAIADAVSVGPLRSVAGTCPALQHLVVADRAAAPGEVDWEAALARESSVYVGRATHADDPAVLIYTSGTTGPPKGALIPHRALIGNLPGFVASQNWFGFPLPQELSSPSATPADDQVFWSPADWAWTGGLMDALLPTLYFGRSIVAFHGRFNAERAFELMQRYRVTHTFLFPTALRAMMKAVPEPRRHFDLALRAIMSAGEAVGDAVFAYGQQQLGITINEMFGQTEMNYVVGNCSACWPARPGSMGRPYPGHRVAVIDDEGRECPPGTPGEVAVHRCDIHGDPDPVFFLGYWRNDGATRAKFTGDPDNSWCRTGDTAVMDEDGYLWYQGRSDDVFKVAGYRIGPSEIENCLVKHPAVANAAVVPKPDPERGALVKAYVVLAPGHTGDEALVQALQQHVRGRLAPYQYPKEIEFIDALPMTTTGKVQRRLLRLREEERVAAASSAR